MNKTNSGTEDKLAVQREEHAGRGTFFIEQGGRRIAVLDYVRLADARVTITHTEVEPALQGRGIARRLVDAAVAWARDTHTLVAATCSYVRTQFEQDASIRDVYSE